MHLFTRQLATIDTVISICFQVSMRLQNAHAVLHVENTHMYKGKGTKLNKKEAECETAIKGNLLS